MARDFFIPNRIISGRNAVQDSKSFIKAFGKKALVVTGPSRISAEFAKEIENLLTEINVEYYTFKEITGEPTDLMINNGLYFYKKECCDFLIGIGGGSALDSVKAIALLASQGGKISDYFGVSVNVPIPPIVAIPTTAGTGSEVTQFTIITDTKTEVKMLLKGSSFMPALAIIDPIYTISMPPKITAATGLDALTHAVEAYTSRMAQPLSDTFAISAIKRIFNNLTIAFHNGDDIDAREQMSIAALEAGIAFNNSSVTLVHGMSRPLGNLFHIPHGLSNAMLLKDCLSYVIDGAYDRFGELGRQIGFSDSKDTNKESSEKFLQAIISICNECEIPTLREYGIVKNEYMLNINKMAYDAMKSGSPANTLKTITKESIISIYKNLW